MGASCWQDLSRLFMEGLVSCYHWDVAACGNSGENRPLMPPPLGSPTPFLCSPFDGSSVKCSSATGGPTYRHPRGGGGGGAGGGGGGRTHTARRPRHKSHSALDQCGLSFCFSGKSLGIVKLLAFDAGISDFMSNEIKFFLKKKLHNSSGRARLYWPMKLKFL